MRRKLASIATVALILVAAVACLHVLYAPKTEKLLEQSATAKPALQKPAPASSVIGVRRDADYWPQQPHPIQMRYRALQPTRVNNDPGADVNLVGAWIVQFGGPLDRSDIERLQRYEVQVLFPTVANAFHVRASRADLARACEKFVPKILGWAQLQPSDRLMPAVAERLAGRPAREIHLQLELYSSADPQILKQAVGQLGGISTVGGSNWLEVRGPGDLNFATALAALDGVYAVNFPRPPLQVCDLAANNASNVTPVQGAPLNLNGTGINIMVRDQGAIFNHPDFGSRIVFAPDTFGQPAVLHSTHVAGIIGATGLADPTQHAMGAATACQIVCYDLLGDDVAEPLDAEHTYGALLSNHSYGIATGWNGASFTDNQNTFGTYSSFAANWDAIVRSDNLIMVKAAGNARDGVGPGHPHNGTLANDGDYYDCVDMSSTGKNIICVGAAAMGIQAGSPSPVTCVLPSSASGPCSDGRLKPEIIADGDTIVSCNTSAAPGNQYTTLSGTSMACAVVTGSTALFLQHYQQRFGTSAVCPPDYVRAVYAQTATDMGRPGPDYLHGFGMLDLNAAITLFDNDAGTKTRILNRTVSASVPECYFRLTSDGVTPIKVTLCWTDDAADILAKQAVVNDLNLRLVRVADQAQFQPFVLDPTHPELPATNGVNSVDTIQQVLLVSPAAGNYLVAVRASTLATATNFTLASSHVLFEDLAPIANIKASSTAGKSPLSITFDASASSDPDGSIAKYLWTFGDGATAQGSLAAHTYTTGSYTATLQVIDDQGASATASVLIGVDNVPPQVVLTVSPVAGPAPLVAMFSSAGTFDLDGNIVSYFWDLGDGASSKAPQVTHTYATPGLYFASLTVLDDGGASAKGSVSVLSGELLKPDSASFGLNFQKIGQDHFTLSTKTLKVPTTLAVLGLTGSIHLGLAQYSFKLDGKGRFNTPPLSITLTPVKQQLKVQLKSTNLGGAFLATKATNRTTTKEVVPIPFALYLDNGTVFGSTGLNFIYTATQGKKGAGKLSK